MNVTFEYKGWRFEWDSEKEAKNIREHGIDFRHAAISFRDGESIIDPDYKHSISEERRINLGLDGRGQILAVCVTWRETESGNTIYRIISAHELSAKNVPRFRKRIAQKANTKIEIKQPSSVMKKSVRATTRFSGR